MTVFGVHASHEQIPPGVLVDAVVRAEAAGFGAANLAVEGRFAVRTPMQCPELAGGRTTVLDHDARWVLAVRADYDGATIVTLHNLAEQPAVVTLRLDGVAPGTRLVDVLDHRPTDVGADGTVRLEVAAFGSHWLRAEP